MNLIDDASPASLTQLAEFQDTPQSQVQRRLAIAMQLKDSITIVLMLTNGMLLFGVLFLVAIPGLVLYGQRWKQVRNYGTLPSQWVHWAMSLAHELVWVIVFCLEHPHQEFMSSWHLEVGYALGALISLAALINTEGSSSAKSHE